MKAKSFVGIDGLLCLTEEMFSLAVQGKWDDVEAHEAQRIAAIEALVPGGDSSLSEVAAKLKQLLDRNAEIVVLASVEKRKIADELMLSRRLGKAEKAYRDIDAG